MSAIQTKTKIPVKTYNVFKCPSCYQQKCRVKIDIKKETAVIKCSECGAGFKTTTDYFTDPIDVYDKWIDTKKWSKR